MKKLLFFFVAMFSIATLFAQSKSPIEFKAEKHNFGKVKQHIPVTYNFVFKNVSNGMVVIENASAECGCTTPEYPKTPIAKGASKEIKVTYNAEAMGSFTKKVTVKLANVAEPVFLFIEGEVVNAKASAAKPAKGKPVSKKS